MQLRELSCAHLQVCDCTGAPAELAVNGAGPQVLINLQETCMQRVLQASFAAAHLADQQHRQLLLDEA
jgi:hypothetical protein